MSKQNTYQTEWPEGMEETATEQAFYDTVMYLSLDKLGLREDKNYTVAEIINGAEALNVDPEMTKLLREIAAEHPEYLDAVMSNYSGNMGYSSSAMSAAVFTLDGQSSVNYRGTPAGAWMDNADGLSGQTGDRTYIDAQGREWKHLSEFDIQALEYFEQVKNSPEFQDRVNDFIVSGHSKGGHEAFLVALIYSDDISACYGFDGQSISPEMWEELKNFYKDDPEKLKQIRDKIIAINVNDDFVHGLGWTEENGYIASNIYVLEGTKECLENPGANHFIQSFFSDGILNSIDPNGEGALSKFVMEVSNRLMQYPPEQREKAAQAIMTICQAFLGGEWPENFDINDVKQVAGSFGEGWVIALATIAEVLKDPEMREAMIEYLRDVPMAEKIVAFFDWAEKHPILGTIVKAIGMYAVTKILTLAVKIFAILGKIVEIVIIAKQVIDKIVDGVKWVIEKAGHFIEKVKEMAMEAAARLAGFASNVKSKAIKAVKTAWLIAKQALDTIAAGIKKAFEAVKSFISNAIENVKNVFNDIKEGIKNGIDKVGEWFNGAKETIASGLRTVGDKVHDMLEGAKTKIASFAASVKEKVTDAVKSAKNAFTNGVEKAKNAVKTWIENGKDAIVNGISETAETISSWIGKAGDAVKGGIDKIVNTTKDSINSLTATIATASSWIREKAKAAIDSVKTKLSGDMTGKTGINYEMVEKTRAAIMHFSDKAQNIESMLDQVISDASSLRYAHMNIGIFAQTQQMVREQRVKMEQYSENLSVYKARCREVENNFVQMLRVYS